MTPPDFRLSVLDTVPPDLSGDLGAAVTGALVVARAAEAAGYHRFWVAEHHAAVTSVCGQPAMLVGLLAERTSRIRVGSGGVMLPNHSPLTVAEQFALLAAWHGDRIDLGLGRAAGADPLTLQALGRRTSAEQDEGFLADVTALAGFLTGSWPDGHPYAEIVTPRAATPPPVHLLGASVGSAELAARAGYPYVFGRKLAPRLTAPATRAYRRAWSDSGRPGPAPLSVMCGVTCADSQAEADRAALVAGLIRVRVAKALERNTLPDLSRTRRPGLHRRGTGPGGQRVRGRRFSDRGCGTGRGRAAVARLEHRRGRTDAHLARVRRGRQEPHDHRGRRRVGAGRCRRASTPGRGAGLMSAQPAAAPPAPAPEPAAHSVRSSIRALSSNADFRRMWIGQAVSEAGTTISSLAFPLLTLAMTGSALNAGLIATVSFLASLVGQVPAGHLADVVNKRVLLIGSDLVRAGCLFGVGAMALGDWYRSDLMTTLTALNMAAFAIATPANTATMRAVVSDRELAEASALVQGRAYAVSLVAPTVGGFLFALGRMLPFVTDGLTFLFSAACTARIRASLAPLHAAERPRFRMSFARGWSVLWQTRMLRWATLFGTSTNLVVSMLIFSVMLGSGASGTAASQLGLTITAAGLAGLLGSMAGPFVQRRLLLHHVVICSCLIRTLAVLPAVLAPGPLTRSLAMVVVVFTSPVVGAAMSTARLMFTPRDVLGAVTGATGLLATCAQPLAPILAGLLLHLTSGSVTFAVLDGCFLAMAVGVAMPPSLRVSAAR